MTDTAVKDQIKAILMLLSPEEKQLLSRVIMAEREKLHLALPRDIKTDLRRAVNEVVK